MNAKSLGWAGTALLSAALLTSCSSTPKGESTTATAYQKGVPGGVIVETYKVKATVTAIDGTKRKVTLVTADGKATVYKAGPEVINFDQIQIGDSVKAMVAEELVVFLAEAGAPTAQGAAALVALAPKGAKPGGLTAETVQVTAKVVAIDLKKHKATLQFPDGSTKSFAVRKDVDLTQRKVGQEVVIRSTEAVAILVEKP